MNKQRVQLISDLSQGLDAAPRAGKISDLALYWLLGNFALVLLLIWLSGPFRPGSLQQLGQYPQFLIESLFGVVAIVTLTVASLRSAIPHTRSKLGLSWIPLTILGIWSALFIAGLWFPALPPSMIGMRAVPCEVTTLVLGLPGLALGILALRSLWPLHGAWAGLTIGLAAGAVPALIMQFACMYTAEHVITNHLLPGLLLGPIGMLAGWLYLRR